MLVFRGGKTGRIAAGYTYSYFMYSWFKIPCIWGEGPRLSFTVNSNAVSGSYIHIASLVLLPNDYNSQRFVFTEFPFIQKEK